MGAISISVLMFWSVVLLVMLIMSAFFSGAETAFTAVNKLRVRNLSEKKVNSAAVLERLLEKPGRVITTLLIGSNIVNIATSTLATALVISYFGPHYDIALITTVVTVIMTILIVVFGEIIPKNIAITHAEKFSLSIAPFLRLVMKVMGPISTFLSGLSRVFIRTIGGNVPEKGSVLTTEELQMMLKVSEEEGIIEEEEKEMIQGIFDLSKIIVREIMTPRTDMACIELNSTVDDVIDIASESGHSRIPVFEDSIDNVKGVIYIKDLLKVTPEDKKKGIKKFIKEAHYVPETKKVDELLSRMRINKNHIAVVVDEYGGTAGVVSIEDILEQIVGEIQDEFDEEDPIKMKKLGENLYSLSAKTSIWEVNELLEINIPESEDYDSLGGFICDIVGEIPLKNRVIEWENLIFKVLDASKQQVLMVQVQIINPLPIEDQPKPNEG